jgi:septum formation protein
LGIEFEVLVSGVDEVEQGPAEQVALENASRKARAVAAQRPDALVLGVDTVVSLDGTLYGKPADREEAERTLQALAGRGHQVLTGICLIQAGRERGATASTMVAFRPLDERILSWYLETGEWRGRAGGYAIQGSGAVLVRAIEGGYLNVVGLPVNELLALEPGLLAD